MTARSGSRLDARWASLLLPSVALWAACTSLTHADEYAAALQPSDNPLCTLCASRPDLRHPPCGPTAPEPAGDVIVVFAMRALDLGIRASGWQSGYLVGFDQDCSDRSDGVPTSCTPRSTAGWVELGNGVDNSLATRVIYPLIQDTGTDVQGEINQSLEAGAGSLLLIVDSWNGLPDDPQVGARLVAATRVVNSDGRTTPSWSGDDDWEVFADRWDPEFPGRNVPDATAKSKDAYVSGGVLVWDARSIQPFRALLAVGAANIELDLSNVVLYGQIMTYQQPRQLINSVMGGVWSSFLASRNAGAIAQVATRCDLCGARQYTPEVEQLIQDAPDMLLPTSMPPGACDAISVGFLGSYVEARKVARIVPLADVPLSCPNAAPCTR